MVNSCTRESLSLRYSGDVVRRHDDKKPDEEISEWFTILIIQSETARVIGKLEFYVAKQRSCPMPREKSIEYEILSLLTCVSSLYLQMDIYL